MFNTSQKHSLDNKTFDKNKNAHAHWVSVRPQTITELFNLHLKNKELERANDSKKNNHCKTLHFHLHDLSPLSYEHGFSGSIIKQWICLTKN